MRSSSRTYKPFSFPTFPAQTFTKQAEEFLSTSTFPAASFCFIITKYTFSCSFTVPCQLGYRLSGLGVVVAQRGTALRDLIEHHAKSQQHEGIASASLPNTATIDAACDSIMFIY
eukprot:6202587-Pleurochrysis_carterae.AAC.3